MDRRRLVAAAVVVALLALAGCGGPVPKTEVVCEGCVSAVEETADATNRSITVEESVTHVYLRESGDARVEARLMLSGADVDALRANETLLASVRESLVAGTDEGYDDYEYDDEYGYGPSRPAFQREDLDVRMDGSELVVTFRAPNVSQSRLGATLSSHFYRADGYNRADEIRPEEPWEIGTDRLVVHGPDGTDPLVRPKGATREGDTLVWQGGETVDTRTYLVFGRSGAGGGLHARIVIASEVFLWATPTAVFGAIVPTVVLFGLAALFALRYPGYVTDGWDVRRDLMFWGLVGIAATLVAAAAGAVAHALLGLALLVVTPFLVGGVWWIVRPDDAAIFGGSDATGEDPDAAATARDPDVDSSGPADETASVDTDATTATPATTASTAAETDATGTPAETVAGTGAVGSASDGRVADATPTGLSSGQRVLLALAGSVAAVLVVTALVAADYRATYAGFVAIAAGFVPLVAFPVLGFAVTLPERADLRSVLVVMTTAAPWLAAFSLSVQGGTETFGPLVVTSLWGIGVVFAGLVLFYGVLWAATWRS